MIRVARAISLTARLLMTISLPKYPKARSTPRSALAVAPAPLSTPPARKRSESSRRPKVLSAHARELATVWQVAQSVSSDERSSGLSMRFAARRAPRSSVVDAEVADSESKSSDRSSAPAVRGT